MSIPVQTRRKNWLKEKKGLFREIDRIIVTLYFAPPVDAFAFGLCSQTALFSGSPSLTSVSGLSVDLPLFPLTSFTAAGFSPDLSWMSVRSRLTVTFSFSDREKNTRDSPKATSIWNGRSRGVRRRSSPKGSKTKLDRRSTSRVLARRSRLSRNPIESPDDSRALPLP
jgi:hypothetical protein